MDDGTSISHDFTRSLSTFHLSLVLAFVIHFKKYNIKIIHISFIKIKIKIKNVCISCLELFVGFLILY